MANGVDPDSTGYKSTLFVWLLNPKGADRMANGADPDLTGYGSTLFVLL